MARISPLYPTRPVDVSEHLQLLPEGKAVPPLPG
ncbi:hypothetical protein LKMONMHP_4074 [Methylobacterium organophilum]|uniref:Uncharacterized protein n=1 Tax=Methylobacterium organophilum TaxID=410 RepID=A0ABQ4TE47_METOR|nr:hypothetical protein LKMONMHP_4074 [Methylobacterium organophilum]